MRHIAKEMLMINNYSSNMANVVNGFEVLAEWIASVINVLQKCVKAIVSSCATLLAWHACRIIVECERHGCDQVQYGECHPSVLSPCCVRRICPIRLMSPTHHFTQLAKHYGFTKEELNFIINYDIKYRMGDKLKDAA
jgi:hypothetical protein